MYSRSDRTMADNTLTSPVSRARSCRNLPQFATSVVPHQQAGARYPGLMSHTCEDCADDAVLPQRDGSLRPNQSPYDGRSNLGGRMFTTNYTGRGFSDAGFAWSCRRTTCAV